MVAVLDSPFIDMTVRPGRWNVGPSEGNTLRRKQTGSKGERWQSEERCNDQNVGAVEAQPRFQDVNVRLAILEGRIAASLLFYMLTASGIRSLECWTFISG